MNAVRQDQRVTGEFPGYGQNAESLHVSAFRLDLIKCYGIVA
jgi:hypothetical protein